MTDALLSDADVGLGSSSTSDAAPSLLSDDDVGLDASAPQASTPQSVAASPFIGFNRGVAEVAGAPVDFTNWLMGKAGLPVSETPLGGSKSIERGMGLIGANPEAPEHQPRSDLEKILQAGGSGAAQMVVPEAALGAAGRAGVEMAPAVGEFLGNAFGSASTPAAAAKSAAIGAASGAAGQTAANVVPQTPGWQEAAQLSGNLLGGGLGAVATEVHPWQSLKSFTAPLNTPFISPEGQQQLAGQTLRSAATSPTAAIDAIENEPQQLVPGSKPTTFQLTGDMGLGGLERQVQTQNPALFNDARAAQNQARVAALGNIQTTGSPEDVSAALRARLNDLSTQADANVTGLTQGVQQAVTGLGGDQSPAFYGEQIRNAVQPQVDQATQNAAAATAAIGGAGTPEEYGAALRDPLQASKDAARTARRQLYQAVDPTGSLNVVAAPLRQAADAAAARLSPLAAQPAGEEASILGTIRSLPDVVPFNDLQALDARVTAAMSAERASAGETPVWGRLSQMKAAVQDAIDNGVANQIAHERAQVENGNVSPDNTIEARVGSWESQYYPKVVKDPATGRFVAAAPPNENDAGIPGNRAPNAPNGTEPSGANPGVYEGKSGPGGSTALMGSAGNSPGRPNFTPEAAGRLSAAKQAHAQYAQTYRQGSVGNVLKTNGFAGQYRMPNASVPDAVFAKGPKGFETATAFRQAVKDDPAALSAAHNFAAMTLRRVAERPDGTIDPAKFSAWKSAYSDALRAFPGLMAKFATAAKASEELGKFAPYPADMAPFQLPEAFFHAGAGGKESVDNLRRLVGDQRAKSILQDYAASKLKATALRPDGTLDPAAVARFQKAHTEALKSFPHLNQQFSNVAKASETINALSAAHKKAIDAVQASAIGKIMHAAPEDVVKHIGSIFGQKDASAQMERLAAEAARGGPQAVAGLRKSIADFINQKFVSNTEAGTSGTNLVKSDPFQQFLKTSRPALLKVFNRDEVSSMEAIAADLHRANRSVTAVRIPGGSNTAQDLTAIKRGEHKPEGSLLNALIVGGGVGYEAGGIHGAAIGAASGLAKHVIGLARAAGYTKVDELVRDALLDPDLAARLMKKAPLSSKSIGPSLGQKLMRVGTFSAMNQLH